MFKNAFQGGKLKTDYNILSYFINPQDDSHG